jgi:hypothetical protein
VTIGTAGNPVGGNGLVLNNTTGHLSVASLSSYSAGSAAFVVGAGTFTGAAGTQLSTATGVLSSNGNSAVNASNSTLGLTLASVSSTGSASYGISLASVDGTINVASGSIANAATADVTVSGSDVAFTYGGTISDDLGSLVTIASSQGTYNFSGAITDLNNGSGNGISLTGNTGATISFTGGTVLSTGANAAFTATGGGTVNVSGTNTVTTSTGTAVRIVSTTIGGAGVKFDSVSSNGGANSAIVLDTTGAGTFTAGGGTIANKSVDAITLSNTDGPVVLESMILEDIGSMAGGFHVNSGHDAIHGQQVRGGLTLDGVTIRRISDNAVNGSVFGNITGATVWNGLTIVNSTIEDTNRFHVSGVGDANNEGAVRILGISGTVSITNSTLRRGAELIDFFAGSGTLNLTATNNQFHQAYKEFTSGTTASVGNHCFDVTLQAGVNANITVGDRSNVALANDFLNCRAGSVRVANDPGATGHANVTIGRNTFAVNDHSSGFGGDFDFPMGGVAMIGLSSAATWDVVVDANHFDEATNASGANGQFSLMMQGGTWQVLAEDNVFDTPGNAPWYVRADGASTSSKVLFRNNTGVQGFFNCPDASCGGGYNGPGLRSVADVQNGGALQLTIDGDDFAAHDTFFDPGPTVTARILAVGAPGTLCLNLQNNAAPDGYGLERYAGTFNLYQPSGSGTCPPNSVCQLALAANGNSGGAGNGATLPPAVTVAGTINIVPTACAIPTGGIF